MRYQQEMAALLEKAERSLDAARVLIGSEYYEFSSLRRLRKDRCIESAFCNDGLLLPSSSIHQSLPGGAPLVIG
jgi:hypothetical protein